MSALLVDEPIVPLPVPAQGGAWRHVDAGRRAHLVAVPSEPGETQAVGAPVLHSRAEHRAQAAPLRLTDRGIAVVVSFFLGLVALAAVVLVTSFLSVSNDPFPPSGAVPGLVVGLG